SVYFFFSSRRRHTRSKRDWSSDVCSSDLDQVSLQFPFDLAVVFLRLVLGLDVRLGRLVVTHSGTCDCVEGVVQVPVAEPVEAVTGNVARGGWGGCNPG